ncbi:LOW QUALITY PROTEIN: patched domain-containing protein 3 [Morus bassanus]
MEKGIQYLRELAMLEVIYDGLNNEQLSKDPDEVQCTEPTWSAPSSHVNSLAVMTWKDGEEQMVDELAGQLCLIVSPLYQVIRKKNNFKRGPEQRQAFGPVQAGKDVKNVLYTAVRENGPTRSIWKRAAGETRVEAVICNAVLTSSPPAGVGVDDMFIMITSWEQNSTEKDKSDAKSRLAELEAALSVSITTLTDVLAFFIGTLTAFPSMRSFCLYTGTAFVFCYIYPMTFFGAIIVFNHKREQGNHWLTCTPVGVGKDQANCLYNACCIGNCSRQSSQPESEHPVNTFFINYYGPFFTNKWIKIIVVLLYGAYLGGSIYGCTQIRERVDLQNLASDSSYVISFYYNDDKYFSASGPRVTLITESVDYWNETVCLGIKNRTQNLEGTSKHIRTSESRLRVYTKLARSGLINISNKILFINNLPRLLQIFSSFEWDINKTQDKTEASHFFIQTVNTTSAIDEKNLLSQLGETAKQRSIPLMVCHPAFIYYDQYLVIVQNTVQNIVVAAKAMLVVFLLLIPNPLHCLWVTLAIASVIIGVAGFTTFWIINLDSISIINLVICTGFSDFSARITYVFITSGESSANKRAIKALSLLGYPLLQGAVPTILRVVVPAAAKAYIFRTFFKITFLVSLFGALHILGFILVFLTFFGNFGRSPHNTKSKKLELKFRNHKDCL